MQNLFYNISFCSFFLNNRKHISTYCAIFFHFFFFGLASLYFIVKTNLSLYILVSVHLQSLLFWLWPFSPYRPTMSEEQKTQMCHVHCGSLLSLIALSTYQLLTLQLGELLLHRLHIWPFECMPVSVHRIHLVSIWCWVGVCEGPMKKASVSLNVCLHFEEATDPPPTVDPGHPFGGEKKTAH